MFISNNEEEDDRERKAYASRNLRRRWCQADESSIHTQKASVSVKLIIIIINKTSDYNSPRLISGALRTDKVVPADTQSIAI